MSEWVPSLVAVRVAAESRALLPRHGAECNLCSFLLQQDSNDGVSSIRTVRCDDSRGGHPFQGHASTLVCNRAVLCPEFSFTCVTYSCSDMESAMRRHIPLGYTTSFNHVTRSSDWRDTSQLPPPVPVSPGHGAVTTGECTLHNKTLDQWPCELRAGLFTTGIHAC